MKSIAETRRVRLRELVDRHDGGRTARLTKRMGWATSTLAARYLSESPGNQKSIGNRLARSLEAAYGMPPNFLDSPPELGSGEPIRLDSLEQQLLLMFRRLSSDSQERILGRVQSLYAREYPASLEPFGPTVFESDVRERHEVAKDHTTRRTRR